MYRRTNVVHNLKLGDLAHLKVFGQHTIVLGSYDVACELFDKRSAMYSDRPDMVMGKLYVTSYDPWHSRSLTRYATRTPQERLSRSGV